MFLTQGYRSWVCCIEGRFFTIWATREAIFTFEVGWWWSLKRYIQVLTADTCRCDLILNKGLCNIIKNLEMKSSWINRVGPKSNDRYLYNRRIMEVTQRECSMVMEEEIGITQLQARKAKDHWEPPEARRLAWRDSPSELPAGANLADISISGFLPPEQWENKSPVF